MISHIEVILIISVIFFIFILFYSIVCFYFEKHEEELEQKRKEKLIILFEEREKANPVQKQKINKQILTKLKQLPYLYIFGEVLEKNDVLIEGTIGKAVSKNSYNPLFSSLALMYEKKDNVAKAYYAYILSFIKPKTKQVREFLKNCILSDSIYCVDNALLAYSSLGDVDIMIEAYLMMSKKNIYYDNRLVVEELANFAGSKEKLCKKLYQNFDKFNEQLRIGFLKFFRQCRYDIRKELFEELKIKGLEKEVEIEMIRYFSKISYEEVASLLLEKLENNYYNDFEYDVVMIQTLANYPSDKTIKVLKNALSSYNYHVRYNAGKSLSRMTNLTKITGLTDPFAKDMIEAFISQEV
ncbi:MAG: HEAT repeat domain-containing protein [Lachnospiraceae bacterium]|nr:HEAT repeat domain-containing protein [Lachnospiraceae bacterium]